MDPNQSPNQSPTNVPGFPPNPAITPPIPPQTPPFSEASLPSPLIPASPAPIQSGPPPAAGPNYPTGGHTSLPATMSSPFDSPSPFSTAEGKNNRMEGFSGQSPAAYTGPTAFNPPPTPPQSPIGSPTEPGQAGQAGPNGSSTSNQGNPNTPPPPPDNGSMTVQSPGYGKFPLMLITILVIVIISGFAGSFLFFRFFGVNTPTTNLTPKITPPVSEEPAQTTVSEEELSEYENPFALTGKDDNPFASEAAEYENPFSDEESTNSAYQNPFDPDSVGSGE